MQEDNKHQSHYSRSGRYAQEIEEWQTKHPNTKYIWDKKQIKIIDN